MSRIHTKLSLGGKVCGFLTEKEISKRLPSYIQYIEYIGNSKHKVQCKECSKIMIRLPHNLKFNCRCKSANAIKKNAYLSSVNSIFSKIGEEPGFSIFKCNNCSNTVKRKGADLHRGCASCRRGHKTKEQDVSNFVKSLGFYTEKIRIERKEIDVYIKEKSIGIEYCGLYWHREGSSPGRSKYFHKEKMDLFLSKGIRSIFIFEDEWLNRESQVKSFIRSTLGKNEIKVNARNCYIAELTKKEGVDFLERYHIQGSNKNSNKYYGLYHSKDLIGVISSGPHPRGYKDSLVLDRLCFKENTTARGGASKLFSRLILHAKLLNYNKIISWSDNRWSIGGVYKAIGFEQESVLPPDYSYFKNMRKRFSKQSLKKTPEEKKLNMTESELRANQGFHKIWDCGKIRWIFNIKKET